METTVCRLLVTWHFLDIIFCWEQSSGCHENCHENCHDDCHRRDKNVTNVTTSNSRLSKLTLSGSLSLALFLLLVFCVGYWLVVRAQHGHIITTNWNIDQHIVALSSIHILHHCNRWLASCSHQPVKIVSTSWWLWPIFGHSCRLYNEWLCSV